MPVKAGEGSISLRQAIAKGLELIDSFFADEKGANIKTSRKQYAAYELI
jgi:hypothetical protein